jgi:GGDEF domain-containing protein
VTVSGGYAVFPEHGNRGDVLVAKADGALYEAKEAGRDRIQRA